MSKQLMKGNEALAEAALRAGCRFYSGYPITPQTEILEYLAKRMDEVGGTFVQTESELAGINMLLGAAAAGARALTSSAGPGFSLNQEGISYLVAADLPAVIINVMRIGTGLGDIAQGQGDYWQMPRGGGHGDYRTIVLAPASVQENCDMMTTAFDLAEKYRHPVLVASDAAIGQMVEGVELKDFVEHDIDQYDWAIRGCKAGQTPRKVQNVYYTNPQYPEFLRSKYQAIEDNEQRWESYQAEDADVVLVAYGISSRISKEAVNMARAEGFKLGLIRPITLWPYPVKAFETCKNAKAFIDLKNPDGKAAFLKLLETADVFLTNVRLPSLGRLGLDYETLHKAYPGLVYAHFSGFGPKGPDAAKPGFDSTAFWLRSGPMADWQVPGSFPFTPTYAFGDMATSSAFLSGILMALIGKKSTGMGTFVSTSLFASGIWCNAIGVVSHQPQFGGERPNDPLRPADPFCHFYQCSDGKWIGVFDNEYRRELPKFANLFGMPEIADDPRAASLEALHETDYVVEIVTRLNAIFKTKTVVEWEAFLSENNVSCERMRTIRDVSTDEQAIANGYVQKVTFKDDLEVMMPCPPMQFTEYAMRPYTSAGRLGADTDSIFHDLGYTDSEIAAMKDSGAIQ